MRQLARFTVAVLDISHDDFLIDPTAGSGGFLLEALLQTWHRVEREFEGQEERQVERLKYDFAHGHVYGVEIHDILARICKINLLLHHDGHTNIEGGRSCLDLMFTKPRLNPPVERFSRVVGNPPFGDTVEEDDEDKLGANRLENFVIAAGRRKVESEQLIVERCIDLLEPEGRFGLVLPDGLLNNQGEQSNCPRTRRFMASRGRIEAIISLPDHAFRKAGAQNKTSILFFQKFASTERRAFQEAFTEVRRRGVDERAAIAETLSAAELDYFTFLAEANNIGYAPTGQPITANDLYRAADVGALHEDQTGTILGEWQMFYADPKAYEGRRRPDCMAVRFTDLWQSHSSNRLDPKYHLFQREAQRPLPDGWIRVPIKDVMRRRMERSTPEDEPDRLFTVMTIAQTGDIRSRESGKGKAPPEWLGTYFEDMRSTWYAARPNDVVYSSIDLWKGCIALVPADFDGALVTKEFPIYEVTDDRLRPAFLQTLLRTRYYQRAFRAITTGHSNRRRTQRDDFEALEITFPEDSDRQVELVREIINARQHISGARSEFHHAMNMFSDLIDDRGEEELPEIDDTPVDEP